MRSVKSGGNAVAEMSPRSRWRRLGPTVLLGSAMKTVATVCPRTNHQVQAMNQGRPHPAPNRLLLGWPSNATTKNTGRSILGATDRGPQQTYASKAGQEKSLRGSGWPPKKGIARTWFRAKGLPQQAGGRSGGRILPNSLRSILPRKNALSQLPVRERTTGVSGALTWC